MKWLKSKERKKERKGNIKFTFGGKKGDTREESEGESDEKKKKKNKQQLKIKKVVFCFFLCVLILKGEYLSFLSTYSTFVCWCWRGKLMTALKRSGRSGSGELEREQN